MLVTFNVPRRSQPINIIQNWGLGFCCGSALLNMLQAPYSENPLEELTLCHSFLEKVIEYRERQNNGYRNSIKVGPREVKEDWRLNEEEFRILLFIWSEKEEEAAKAIKAWIEEIENETV